MYSIFSDTQRYILNNKMIIAKVAVEWNRQNNKISTKRDMLEKCSHEMWITFQDLRKAVQEIHR